MRKLERQLYSIYLSEAVTKLGVVDAGLGTSGDYKLMLILEGSRVTVTGGEDHSRR